MPRTPTCEQTCGPLLRALVRSRNLRGIPRYRASAWYGFRCLVTTPPFRFLESAFAGHTRRVLRHA